MRVIHFIVEYFIDECVGMPTYNIMYGYNYTLTPHVGPIETVMVAGVRTVPVLHAAVLKKKKKVSDGRPAAYR